MRAWGTLMRFSPGGDIQKVICAHNERRTRAMASEKVGVCLGVPGGIPHGCRGLRHPVVRQQGDQREDAQEGQRRAADCRLRPLALSAVLTIPARDAYARPRRRRVGHARGESREAWPRHARVPLRQNLCLGISSICSFERCTLKQQ